jgi:hypothetical protein
MATNLLNPGEKLKGIYVPIVGHGQRATDATQALEHIKERRVEVAEVIQVQRACLLAVAVVREVGDRPNGLEWTRLERGAVRHIQTARHTVARVTIFEQPTRAKDLKI